jgi:hypothetical protein
MNHYWTFPECILVAVWILLACAFTAQILYALLIYPWFWWKDKKTKKKAKQDRERTLEAGLPEE